jgi:hypothetical protein
LSARKTHRGQIRMARLMMGFAAAQPILHIGVL